MQWKIWFSTASRGSLFQLIYTSRKNMFTERVWTRSIAPIDQAIHGDCRKKHVDMNINSLDIFGVDFALPRFYFPLLPAWIDIYSIQATFARADFFFTCATTTLVFVWKLPTHTRQGKQSSSKTSPLTAQEHRNWIPSPSEWRNLPLKPQSLQQLASRAFLGRANKKQETSRNSAEGKPQKKTSLGLVVPLSLSFFPFFLWSWFQPCATADQSFWATQQCHQHRGDHHIQWGRLLSPKRSWR